MGKRKHKSKLQRDLEKLYLSAKENPVEKIQIDEVTEVIRELRLSLLFTLREKNWYCTRLMTRYTSEVPNDFCNTINELLYDLKKAKKENKRAMKEAKHDKEEKEDVPVNKFEVVLEGRNNSMEEVKKLEILNKIRGMVMSEKQKCEDNCREINGVLLMALAEGKITRKIYQFLDRILRLEKIKKMKS